MLLGLSPTSEEAIGERGGGGILGGVGGLRGSDYGLSVAVCEGFECGAGDTREMYGWLDIHHLGGRKSLQIERARLEKDGQCISVEVDRIEFVREHSNNGKEAGSFDDVTVAKQTRAQS